MISFNVLVEDEILQCSGLISLPNDRRGENNHACRSDRKAGLVPNNHGRLPLSTQSV
jgi:hypothetical protein